MRRTRPLQEPAEQGREPARQHEHGLVDAAVPEPVGERAAAPEPPPGRHAGQRDVPIQRFSVVWPQEIYGDGGQSGFNVANDALRFNTFTGQANDANFRDGDPTKWVIISAPIFTSPEGSFFYPPIIADPNPAKAGSIFQGSFSVWRTQDWGGNQAYLEANCPEFTTFAGQAGCGDFVPIGNGVPSTDLRFGCVGKTALAARWPGSLGLRKTPARCGRRRAPVACSSPKTRTQRLARRLEPGRPSSRTNDPGPRDQRDLRRSNQCASRVDLVQRLQRQHAGARRDTFSR